MESKPADQVASSTWLLGIILMVCGLGLLVGIVILAKSQPGGHHLMYPEIGVGGLFGLIGVCIGIGLVRSAGRIRASGEVPELDYRHTYRLVAIVLLAIVGALGVRHIFIPPTFGQYGHYRGAAVKDAMKREPRHKLKGACVDAACHKKGDKHRKIGKLHSKDAHARLPCETCHGPGWKHIASGGKGNILVPRKKRYCLRCHTKLAARPGSHPQINLEEHYKFVGVKDPTIDCIECHSPHEPLFMDRDLRTARLHPIVHRCRDCHIGRRNEGQKRPKNHPAIFECNYCHGAIVKDFAKRKHAKLRCTTCHLFFKQSDFAGRIVRDSDPRFCRLCHKPAAFRSKDAPPSMNMKNHTEDEYGYEPGASCLDCHKDRIHGEFPNNRMAAPKAEPPPAKPAPEAMTPPATKPVAPATGMDAPATGMGAPAASMAPMARPMSATAPMAKAKAPKAPAMARPSGAMGGAK